MSRTNDNDSIAVAALTEFTDVRFGDSRLNSRLERIVPRLAATPEKSFPKIFEDTAELEGFYRFLENPKASLSNVVSGHVKQTVERAAQRGFVLAVHDTTEFRFNGTAKRKGLGRLRKNGHGFYGHFSLLMSADDSREPLGVAVVRPWARTRETPTALRVAKKISYAESRRLPSEQDRWGWSVGRVERLLADKADVIHVMDSEADDFSLVSALASKKRRFVIRVCYDRVLAAADEDTRTLKAALGRQPIVCRRSVKLSRRRRLPGGGRSRTSERDAREATLAVSAAEVLLKRPGSVEKSHPLSLRVNVVRVWEESPPEDMDRVEWFLLSTEPIATEDDILAIVDIYRHRWTVEEYFKALKTGCAYEKRQLDSYETLLTALGLFIPIAVEILRLRTLSRIEPDRPASTVLTATQIDVLKRRYPKSTPKKGLTIRDALLLVAKLGGHLRRNGPPGWQVLMRGYHDLLLLENGYRMAMQT